MDSSSDSSFRSFLDRITNRNGASNVEPKADSTELQTKKLLEIEKESTETQEKQLEKIFDSLEGIRSAIISSEKSKAEGSNVNPKRDEKGKVSDVVIKDEDKSSREKLKETVGAVKSIGQDVVSGAKTVGSNVASAFSFGKKLVTDPREALKQVSSKAASMKESAKDILGTEAGYTAESERYGKEFKVAGLGSVEESKEQYKQKTDEEMNAKRVEKSVKQGNLFGLIPEGKYAPPSMSNLESSQDSKAASISANAESDNVETPTEIMAKETDKVAELTATSVDVQKQQLGLLKTISESLAPKTPSEMQEQKGAPVTQKAANDEAAAPAGLSIGDIDLPGKGTSKTLGKTAGKATGMGGKILGGLGKAAKFLGPVAAAASAAYSGFEGYQNTNANFDVEDGKEATTGQKISSTLGGVASGLTFGLLDERTAAQGIHKAGSAIGDFFSGSDKKVETLPAVKTDVAGSTPSYAGSDVVRASTENADMMRDLTTSKNAPSQSIVSSSISNNNTTSYVPIKPGPRPEYAGSALDRYQGRVSVY